MYLNLILHCILWCVVWARTPVSLAAGKQCLNDGYPSPDGTCKCLPYFSGDRCETTQCLNGGRPIKWNDQTVRCVCPPGFLGTHCEPAKCIAGETGTFKDAATQRGLSILLTYNSVFKNQLANTDDDVLKAICDGFDGDKSVSSVQLVIPAGTFDIGDLDSCQSDIKTLLDTFCPEDTCDEPLLTQDILNAVTAMGQDSRLLIVSNYGLNDTQPDLIEQMKQYANAMRIQIHSLLLSPPVPNPNTIYGEPAYALLEDLAESTLGFYITPFEASGGQKFGQNNMQDVITELFALFFHGNVVERVDSDGTDYSTLAFTDQTGVFYVAVRGKEARIPQFTIELLVPSNGILSTPAPYLSTGYWNMFKIERKCTGGCQPTQGVVLIKCNYQEFPLPSSVMIITESDAIAHFAVTTDDNVDASSPFAIQGPNTVVAYVVEGIDVSTLTAEFTNVNFTKQQEQGFQYNATQRAQGCQFNALIGNVDCPPAASTFVRLRSNGNSIAVLPFYCASSKSASLISSLHVEPVLAALDDEDSCVEQVAPFLEKPGDRALAIAMPQKKSLTKIFVGKDNLLQVFQAINSHDEGYYASFLANIYDVKDNGNVANTQQASDFAGFLKNVMDGYAQSLNDTSVDNCADATDGIGVIFDVLSLADKTNFDLFLVVNYAYDPTADTKGGGISEETVLLKAIDKRVRLIVLSVGCESLQDAESLKDWNDFAAKTGGFATYFSGNDEFLQFVKSYKGFYKSDVVHIANVQDHFLSGTYQTTEVSLEKDIKYKLLMTSSPAVDHVIVGSSDPIQATEVHGSLSIFDVSVPASGRVMLSIKGIQEYFHYLSVRLIEVDSSRYGTIAFTTGQSVEWATSYPAYNPSTTQQIVSSAQGDTQSVTLYDAEDKIVIQQNSTKRTCQGFDFWLDYNWACHEQNVIYRIVTETTSDSSTFTRTSSFICASGGGHQGRCLNGGTEDTDETCKCPFQWTGDVCERPVCMNGGNVTSALLCQCPEHFSGAFCEHSLSSCGTVQPIPEFHSLLTTVIFVVERSQAVKDSLTGLPSFSTLPPAQYIVVHYGGNNASVDSVQSILSSTDPTHLKKALEFEVVHEIKDARSVDAIKTAISMQLTPSSILFWLADEPSPLTDSILVEDIAVNHVSVRGIFSTDLSNNNIASLGVSSSFYQGTFTEFFSGYIQTTLKAPGSGAYENRLNLIHSSRLCDETYTFAVDKDASTLIVNAFITEITVKDSGDTPLTSIPVSGSDNSKIYTFDLSQKGSQFTITTTKKTGNDGKPCAWTAEILSKDQIAYGFVSSLTSSDVFSAPPSGDNFLVIYPAEGTDATDKTITTGSTAVVRQVKSDGNISDSVEQAFTARDNCLFQWSLPITCSSDIRGYEIDVKTQVQLADQTQYYINKGLAFPCLNNIDCKNGGYPTETDGCSCTEDWDGVACERPVCRNGGTPSAGTCACLPIYNGFFCENMKQSAITKNPTILVIQDVCGADADLGTLIDAILGDYVSLFNDLSAKKIALAVTAPGGTYSDFGSFATADDFKAALAQNRAAGCATNQTSLQEAFDQYDASVGAVDDASAFVIFVTQSSVPEPDRTKYNHLKDNNGLLVLSVGITKKNELFSDSSVLKSLGDFKQTYDEYKAVNFLRQFYGTDEAPPKQVRPKGCASLISGMVYILADISNVLNGDQYKDLMVSIGTTFATDFNANKFKTGNPRNCSMGDMSDFQGITNVYHTGLYNSSIQNNPIFCSSNMDSFVNTIKSNFSQPGALNMSNILTTLTNNLKSNPECRCTRINEDESTYKRNQFILWMPITKTSNDDSVNIRQAFDAISSTITFKHFVLPFGFDLSDSQIWSSVNPDGVIKRGDTHSVKEVVEDLWTQMCRTADVIPLDATSEPLSDDDLIQIQEGISFSSQQDAFDSEDWPTWLNV